MRCRLRVLVPIFTRDAKLRVGGWQSPLERALYSRYLYDVLYPTDYRTILVTLTRQDRRGKVFGARALT